MIRVIELVTEWIIAARIDDEWRMVCIETSRANAIAYAREQLAGYDVTIEELGTEDTTETEFSE